MSLLDQAKADIQSITGNTGEFAIDMILKSKSNKEIAIVGLHTKHHLGIDTDGNAVNTQKAHVCFFEKQIIDKGSSIRNGEGEVDLDGWLVFAKDSTGVIKTYTFQSWFPDETLGLITAVLQNFIDA